MRKFLSLVLALVMAMSLVTISAGAKDFEDDDSITYEEAVDVISAIGVVDGYEDGSFGPGGNLTRGAAAKIICNLILGPTTAAELSADTAPYPDVPTTHTFAGYIAYCQKEGIISGYANGTFQPGNTLTGYAFQKMLLGALGYDSDVEGFTGPNWSINVAKLALSEGLTEDLEGDFNGTRNATREEAALYAFNTLKARMVKYENKSTITVGDVTVTTDAKAEYETYNVLSSGTTADPGTIDNGGYVEFGERHFDRLRLQNVSDAFMRPSSYWTFKSDEIGTYPNKPDATYTEDTPEADIYLDAAMTGDPIFSVYVDGVRASQYDSTKYYTYRWEVNKGEENVKLGNGDGARIEVFKDTSNSASPDHRICIINTYVGEVIGVEDATDKDAAYIELGTLVSGASGYNSIDGTLTALTNDYTIDATGFEVGDVVTFTYSFKNSESVESVALAESVTGTVDSFTTTKKFSMDGTTYEYGSRAVNFFAAADVKTEQTVYLDENGYALYTAESDDNIKNYALVLNAGNESKISGRSYSAWLLYADGTTGVVTTDKAYGTFNGASTSSDYVGQWVTFKTNSKSEVVLTQPTGTYGFSYSYDNDGDGLGGSEVTFKMDNGKAPVDAGIDGTADTQVNSTSVIVVRTKDDKIRVYEGIKNMPSIDTGSNNEVQYSWFNAGSSLYAKLLYVEINGSNTDVDTGSSKTIMLVGSTTATAVETASDKYYMFKGVIDGVLAEDEIALDANDTNTWYAIQYLIGHKYDNLVLNAYAESDGIYTIDVGNSPLVNGNIAASGGDIVSGTEGAMLAAGTTVEKVSGNCIAFNGSAFYTADDCVFYRVDQYGNLQKTTINAVRDSSVGGSHYQWMSYTLNNDAEITGVYWEYTR